MSDLPVANPVEWGLSSLRFAGLHLVARPNVRFVAKAYGLQLIPVLASDLPIGELEAISGKQIRYRRGLSEREQMRVIAHAIGHYVVLLHGLFTGDDLEAWCDAFADALLFPGQTVL